MNNSQLNNSQVNNSQVNNSQLNNSQLTKFVQLLIVQCSNGICSLRKCSIKLCSIKLVQLTIVHCSDSLLFNHDICSTVPFTSFHLFKISPVWWCIVQIFNVQLTFCSPDLLFNCMLLKSLLCNLNFVQMFCSKVAVQVDLFRPPGTILITSLLFSQIN